MNDEETPRRFSRRSVLKRVGLGGAAVGAGFLGGSISDAPVQARESRDYAIFGSTTVSAGTGYEGTFDPPATLGSDALDRVTIPPPSSAHATREYAFDVVEVDTAITAEATFRQWTYNGHAPGPIVRATEGDLVRIHLRNQTDRPHNLHLHGRHAPHMDGWEPIPPGGEFTYEVTAGPAGVHPYHCHTPPLAHHVGRGLYGAFIVDPVEPRPPAHEFVLMLSGWDLDGNGRNQVYTWNGVAGFFRKFPLKIPAGEPVRLYVLNMTEYDPVASFHLHAQTFDVYRTGTLVTPDEHTDTVTLSQGERAILEFTLPELGRYMFHPHQHHMAEAGAMGWLAAV